jgi:hypothetical protein
MDEACLTYNQLVTYPKVLVASCPAFDVQLQLKQPEPGTLMTFVHLDVYQTSPSVMRDLIRVHNKLRPTLPPMIFCQGHVDDHKFHRFVTRFGWEPLSNIPCTDGTTRRLYVHHNYPRVTDGRRAKQDRN